MITQSMKEFINAPGLIKLVKTTLVFVAILIVVAELLVTSHINERLNSRLDMHFIANLQRLNAALIQYADNHSGNFPDSKNWFDVLVGNPLIIKTDDIGMSSRIVYNRYLSGRSISNLKGNTVVFFEGKGRKNSTGRKKAFYNFSSREPEVKLVTLDGSVYVYLSESNEHERFKDKLKINADDLFWGKETGMPR